MKIYSTLLLLCIFFLSGCSSYFLQKDYIQGLRSASAAEDNSTVYFKKRCEIDNKGNLIVTTHKVIKLSEDIKSRLRYVNLHISSMDELKNFSARIIRKDGSEITFGRDELTKHNTSSGSNVNESAVYSLELNDKNLDGDYLEFVSTENIGFSPLGFSFEPDEAGLKASNVYCEIIVPDSCSLNYSVVNDTVKPVINKNDNKVSYVFYWPQYEIKHNDNAFQKLNIEPEIIAAFAKNGSNNSKNDKWIDFGNWYLDLVSDKLRPNNEIKILAEELTKGITDPKEKLDAIFNYCQKNIRYEQVAIKGGEIIPNGCSLILKRKFGDCKDYSAIIYAMAKSIGIDANLALCFRGRGLEFYSTPVSQFNHCIVNYFYNNKNYWYDGTNRISRPGLTTFDLANQMALVIKKNDSRIVKIDENDNNLLNIKGSLKNNKGGFSANLELLFTNQFAIDFLYADLFLNRTDMKEYLSYWTKENLCRSITISDLKWEKTDDGNFRMLIDGNLPNSYTKISSSYYTSLNKLFPELIYERDITKNDEIFYFPKYNCINIDIRFPEMTESGAEQDKENAVMKYSCRLPIGPFTNENMKTDFIEKYNNTYTDFHKKIKISERTAK